MFQNTILILKCQADVLDLMPILTGQLWLYMGVEFIVIKKLNEIVG